MDENTKHKRVGIVSKDEPQTIIRLEDGTIIKMQIVVFGVYAFYNEDGSRTLNEDKAPAYGINHQAVLFVDTFESVPTNVKRN